MPNFSRSLSIPAHALRLCGRARCQTYRSVGGQLKYCGLQVPVAVVKCKHGVRTEVTRFHSKSNRHIALLRRSFYFLLVLLAATIFSVFIYNCPCGGGISSVETTVFDG
jgi:hypothetical protein